MSVVSSIESVGPCRKRLHIEVPAPAVDAETERVVREYGRKVRLPGFRTGKVPAAVVQQRFKSEIEPYADVEDLHWVTYRYVPVIEVDAPKRIGLIAEEVFETHPEWVYCLDGEPVAIYYDRIPKHLWP